MAEVERGSHTRPNVVIALGIILVIVAIVVCLVPTVNASYTVMVPYQDTETYYEDEPYQAQVEKPLSYRVTESYASQGWNLDLGVYAEAFVSIDNTDIEPGTFVVDFTFTALQRTYDDSDRAYIAPGEVKTLKGLADISLGEDWMWSKSITPGTKTVTETRYRQVERQRIVDKERSETRHKRVTVLDYLLNY